MTVSNNDAGSPARRLRKKLENWWGACSHPARTTNESLMTSRPDAPLASVEAHWSALHAGWMASPQNSLRRACTSVWSSSELP